jgi:hypothetical protein
MESNINLANNLTATTDIETSDKSPSESKHTIYPSHRISVGNIKSSAEKRVSSAGSRTDNTKLSLNLNLNDKILDGELYNGIDDVLGVGLDLNGKFIDEEPYELDAKIDNCFSRGVLKNPKCVSEKLNKNKRFYTEFRGTTGSFSANSNDIPNLNKGKLVYGIVSEKKNYLDKITILNNRIKKLKEQEDQINKKLRVMKNNVIKEEKFRTEKNEMKNVMIKAKIEQKDHLEKVKNNILTEKMKRNEKLEQAREDIVKRNKNVYDLARKDRLILETMVSQLNNHISNVNNYKYIKVKQESIEGKTHRFKKQAEKEEMVKTKYETKLYKETKEKEKLKRKLKELEDVEERCMESLKKTMKNKDEELALLQMMKTNKGSMNHSMIEYDSNIRLSEMSPMKEERLATATSRTKSVARPKSVMSAKLVTPTKKIK